MKLWYQYINSMLWVHNCCVTGNDAEMRAHALRNR